MTCICYAQENWDKIILYYNQYINATSWKLEEATIYKTQIAKAIADIQMLAYEIEGEDATIVDNLVEFKLASQIYLYLAENGVSEQVKIQMNILYITSILILPNLNTLFERTKINWLLPFSNKKIV
ncbi:hypothetical protein RFI_26824 [Reticulomyxa filosa]|uniref:Uncharacterized protein n=1 Tax=Reticulomyxa filosa TaxID=46433 RepID=X6MAQ7_RETFI|nr:hypothetical protein RFI_26824 [Reticulomyxa filosa]|eukprot:ETO10552.1 hypothetical protein RFI_26824 [Reticulomyxa filosa]